MELGNLDLIRSIYAAWERGDYSSAEWAHPEIEFVVADGPSPGSWTGVAAMADAYRSILSGVEGHRSEAQEYRELEDDRVLVLFHTEVGPRPVEWRSGRYRRGERTCSTSVKARSRGSSSTGMESGRSPTSASRRRLAPRPS